MANNLTVTNLKTSKRTEFSEMDGLIKFILATILATMPFFFQHPISFGILSVFLFILTFVSRIKVKTLLLSTASYCIIVVIPYLFGLLMNSFISSFSNNELFTYHQGSYEMFLRLFRLFIIWYVSILYFHTTPMKTVVGLLDKLFTPLKLVGVPVKDYLKVVMCIILELTESGSELKKSLGESMRSTVGESRWKFKINIKGISQIIVSLIVNSFEKIDKIQGFVEKVNPSDLYHYKFKVSKSDVAAVFTFSLVMSLVFMIEKGYWF